jgi:hypothetical protein
MGNSIFDTLATQDTQKIQHDQAVSQSADVFDKLAANNGQPLDTSAPKGPTIGPQPKAGDTSGALGEAVSAASPVGQLTMPLVKGLVGLHDKLREMGDMTQEGKQAHPIQAAIGDLANRIEGLLTGNEEHPEAGIGTGKYGMLTNPITAALIPGAEGEPALAGAVRGGASLVMKGVKAIKGGEEGPGLVKQIIKGKDVAQEPAQAAIREATGASGDATLLEGNKSIVDKPIANIFAKERAAYAQQDKVAGFDMKSLHDKLDATEEQIRNLTETEEDVAKEAKLEKSRTAIMDKIQEAKGRLRQAGVDPEQAEGFYKQRKAAEDFKKVIVQQASSDGQSVNVDGLLESAKKLRFNKYGDRLEQFMGTDGANQFMQKLQDAQKLGVHAVKMRWIAASLPVVGGAASEGMRLIKGITSAASNP